MSQIRKDAHFIRYIGTNNYLHDDPKAPGEMFIAKEGYENAHIWKKSLAQRLVRAWKKEGIKNLEIISVTDAMDEDKQ